MAADRSFESRATASSPVPATCGKRLLGGRGGSLIDHVRSRSSRKHVYQHGQNDEDENGREQDSSHDDHPNQPFNPFPHPPSKPPPTPPHPPPHPPPPTLPKP